jgi:hypothetical protein
MDKYKKGSYMIGDRLMVNGRGYTSETMHTLPEDIDIQPLYTKLENGVTFFYRWRSPLSNHYPAQFTLGEHEYSSSEQYYFAEMARTCKDDGVLGRVMGTDDPALQKSASKSIRFVTEAWKQKRIPTMKAGVRQKVLQNRSVRDFLRETGDSTLAEASPGDDFWGLGLGMNDSRRSDNTKWGQNELGQILEQIRSELD